MQNYQPYPCECCGACCRHVNLIDEMKAFDRGDGVCKNLASNNLCVIYSKRPPLCNGEYVYKKFFSDMSVADFHAMIERLCKILREAKA